MIWHRIADRLAAHFTVVATDLRGYGSSSKPRGTPNHSNYSKRTMAADQVAAMASLGFPQFKLLAHDRGARVGHRMCVDHASAVERAMFLDIAPTLDMYEQTDRQFAAAYFHWFFLIQPFPFPEQLIEANPTAYIDGVMGNRHAGLAPFADEALAAYRQALACPGTAHGMCEDYRAAYSIDLVHDRDDRQQGRKVKCPLRILWGKHGVIESLFDPLTLWRSCAHQVDGHAIDCGHYLAEEAPETLLAEALDFLVD
ncbi:alpha/beta hydrolase fold protein [Salinisphaera hydrothermalis C41B8]|uniref:Alpha/beta hydrolase fold protein n=1 Tax=Salinisphaera hydrothermalis (strain C41B8) TaxID=1304275 RepID=A0A084IL83_SALHC|nr:alpha/beta hydrolase fold protein [Salinisphaera hydrothermalis C41B8]